MNTVARILNAIGRFLIETGIPFLATIGRALARASRRFAAWWLTTFRGQSGRGKIVFGGVSLIAACCLFSFAAATVLPDPTPVPEAIAEVEGGESEDRTISEDRVAVRSGNVREDEPAPTNTMSPTSTAAPTNTAAPTGTATPTYTATSTATTAPTNTPRPSRTPTATAEVTVAASVVEGDAPTVAPPTATAVLEASATSPPPPTDAPPEPTDPPPTDTPVPEPTEPPAPTEAPPPATTGLVTITSFNVDGSDDNEPDEWVEFRNDSGQPLQLEGWKLSDEADHVFWFHEFVMQPGQVCRVYTNQDHTEWCGFTYRSTQAIWNNSGGDCATITDSAQTVVARRCYS